MIHNIPKLQKMSALLLAVFLMVAWGSEVKGQTQYEWRSEAANGNWHAPTHWWIGSATTAGFGVMRFNNNAHLNMTNNNGGSTFNTHAIHFRSGNTSVRTIGGDAIRLFDFGGASGASPYILNTSSATHVLNINLNGGVENRLPLLILLDGTGGLTFNGTINNRDNNINIQGNTSTANTATFNGIISGSGGLFKTNSNITAVFNAANTFTGTTTVEAGVIRLGQDGASFGGATSAIRLGAGGSIDLNGFNTTVRYISERGTGDGGVVQLGSGTLTIVDNEATTRFQSSINGTGGSIVYDPTASSVMSLYNAQGYTGSTTVKAGTVTSSGAMQTSSIIIEGGTFRVTGSDNRLAANPSVTLSGGVFNPRTNETISSLTGTSGTVSLTDASTLTVNNSTDDTFEGVISGIGSLIKSGSGKLSLTNTNTFTGTTVVNAGILEIGNNFASSEITINNGGTFRVTGTETNTITVEDGGILQIANGAVLTVNETLTIKSGGTVDMQGDLVVDVLELNDGVTLVVPSGRNLVASNIIYNGTGAIEFQRVFSGPERWVTFSSPVEGSVIGNDNYPTENPLALFDGVWTQGFPGSNFLDKEPNVVQYNSEARNWGAPSSNTIEAGRGYAIWLYRLFDLDNEDTEINYSNPRFVRGQQRPAGSSFDFPQLTFNGTEDVDSWNLLGNPWGAALDWNSASWTKNNITSFAYILNPNDGTYSATAPESLVPGVLSAPIIAPFQAFWVKANASSPSLTVEPAARVINNDNADLFSADPSPVFTLRLDLDGYHSTTGFRFGEDFVMEMSDYDAYYLTPMAHSFAFIHSLKNDTALLLNSLPTFIDEQIIVPVLVGGFQDLVPYGGSARISWPTFENIPADWNITLVDNETGVSVDLRNSDSYEFQMSSANLNSMSDLSELRLDNSPVMRTMSEFTRFSLVIAPQTTSAPINGELPSVVSLNQNYPNPFNPTTQISYELPASADVRLEVFNIQGQRVASLVNAAQTAGTHTVTFDASNLASGVYLYRLHVGAQVITKKMTLLK